MIKAESLTKKFGHFTAVDNVSFEIADNEVVGFLGPNGAGKSTTMRILTGYISPTSGCAHVGGINVIQDPFRVKAITGYLPENSPVYKDMTVIEFITFVARLRGLYGQVLKNSIDRVISLCSLQEVLRQPIDTLSKGYLHRVCLAQAIVHDPDYLILDEPTDGLDPNQKYEVRKLIREMGGNKTILISTHILEEVDACCSRVIIIANGRIVADAKPSELRKRYGKNDLSEIFRVLTTN